MQCFKRIVLLLCKRMFQTTRTGLGRKFHCTTREFWWEVKHRNGIIYTAHIIIGINEGITAFQEWKTSNEISSLSVKCTAQGSVSSKRWRRLFGVLKKAFQFALLINIHCTLQTFLFLRFSWLSFVIVAGMLLFLLFCFLIKGRQAKLW